MPATDDADNGLARRGRARQRSDMRLWAWMMLTLLGACMAGQAPAREVSEVARDLNLAARFGQMDIAAGHTSDAHRKRFLESRADWGAGVRVVDVELAQLNVPDAETAEVIVDVSWVRIDEGLLRSTRIRQNWQNPGGGWQLDGEERIAGDFGLLGENVTILRPESHDTHFPTKTIR
jgi:hypothetical protein